MSSYMKGYSKRKPYTANRMERGHRRRFMSSPVRHLLESLERESAFEKPYMDYGNPRRKHLWPSGGQIRRFWAHSSYPIQDKWWVEYNRPECVLDARNWDCDEDPTATITIDYRSGWQTGQEILFWVSCDRPDLVRFSDRTYSATLEGKNVVEDVEGTLSSTYWSSASLEGWWRKEFSNPLKMTCRGGVIYKGGWAAKEEKKGTTVVTQSVLVQSSSMTPGSAMVTGTNPVTGARGSNVYALSELGLDPAAVSLAGHHAVTAAAQAYAANAAVQGGRFNNYVANRPIEELSYAERRERLNWFGTPGRITEWYSGVLKCPAVEVDVSCNDEKCEDNGRRPGLLWDSSTSGLVVSAGGSTTVAIISGGQPPYYWNVTPSEFNLSNRTTTGLTNTLNADADACGAALIKVVDACGASCIGVIRETGGVNTNWTTESSCGPAPDGNANFMGITADGHIALDDYCVDPFCHTTCPQLLPNETPPLIDSYDGQEANAVYSWTCN